MLNEQITTLAFSFNEERRIRYFLEAVKDFSPIIVIDNYSTDRTVEIARHYTNRVVQYKNAGYAEHPDVTSYALSQVETEWVYWGRVDEIPPLPLLKELDNLVRADAADIIFISRLNLLFGVPTSTWGSDYQIILFKKAFLNIHESALFELGSILPNARTIKLLTSRDLSLWHFSSYDVAAYTNIINRYSTIIAKTAFEQRRHPRGNYSNSTDFVKRGVKRALGRLQGTPHLARIRLFLLPMMRFLWHYLARGGIRSGWVGLVTSYLMMVEQMLTELKIAELEKGISLEKINAYYDELKARLVAGEIADVEDHFPHTDV